MSTWRGRLSGVVAGMFVAAGVASAAYVTPVNAASADVTLMAVGDIVGTCVTPPCAYDAVSDVVAAASPGAVLALGDISHSGAATDYTVRFARNWQRVKSVTHAVPGNHDYETADGANFFSYFGAAAGAPDGFFSFDIGTWHVVAINSNCAQVGGCQAGSRQEAWLRADLAAHASACTAAFWHHPRYGSAHGNVFMADIFEDLYRAGADLVLSGHVHNYQRFLPQDNAGRVDAARGIIQFIAGTGGASHDPASAVAPNSAAYQDDVFGALRLTLHPTSYDWRFVPVSGTYADAGSATCHHTERAGGSPTPTPTPTPSPTAPTITALQPSRVAGTPVTLSGTAAPRSTLDVYAAGPATSWTPRLLASVAAGDDGRWTHTFSPGSSGSYYAETRTSPPRRSPVVTVRVSLKVSLDRVSYLGKDARGRCVTEMAGGTYPLVPGAPVWVRDGAVSPTAPIGAASVSARGGSGRYTARFGLTCGKAYRLFALSSGATSSGRLADNGASAPRWYLAGH